MRDDEDGKPTPDSDRAAILARRKQFMALALSGLATTACTSGDKESDGKAEPDKTETKSKPDNEIPQPCLSIEPPEPPKLPEVPPHPCLKVAPPEPGDETGETGQAIEDSPEVEPKPPKPEPKPRPCLRKAAPKP